MTPRSRARRTRGRSSTSARQRIGICRVRSSERIWLQSRKASKSLEAETDDEEIVIAGDTLDERFLRVFLDIDHALPRSADMI